MSRFKNLCLSGLTAVGSLATHAQTLEAVVVTASRAEQRSFDAAAAIDSVSRDTIEHAGPQVNLSESLSRVSGLVILNRQNYAQDMQLSVRGFGSRASFGIRGVRLLIDGIPATTPDGQSQGSSISLPSTDRIEVLRGPLAQMYGNSAGGVIQAFTRDAPQTPEFSAQAYSGSFAMRRTAWQLASRIGTLGLVADYSTFDTNGYRVNSKTQRHQFNGKLSLHPTDSTRISLVFNQFEMPLAQDPLGLTLAQFTASPDQAGTNAVSAQVRKITSQSQAGASMVHVLDPDRSVTARVYGGNRDNLQFQANSFWVGLERSYYGVGLQTNAQTRVADTAVQWVAGYEFDLSRERRQGGASPGGVQTPGSLTRNEDNVAQNSDVFVQATAFASEQISLVAGLRSSTVRFQSEDYYLADAQNGSGAATYQAINPVFGLTWHASNHLNLYANFGKGFETPTLAEVAYKDSAGATPLAQFNPGLSAATSKHMELGAKWAPDARSRLDATLFQIDTADEVVVSTSASGRTAFKNAPGTARRGLELTGRTPLAKHVSAVLSASWIDASFTRAYSSSSGNVVSGNKLPGIPQNFVFAQVLWSGPMLGAGAREGSRLGYRAALELTHAGKIFANDMNTASTAGYTTLNLNASHGWAAGKGSLTAYARVDNLTGQRYVGSVIVNQAASQFYEPAPGKNFSFGMRLNLPL